MVKREKATKDKKREPVWTLILLALVVVLAVRFWNVGADAVSFVAEEVKEAEQQATASPDAAYTGAHPESALSDNDYLYADDDDGSVVTMYLTVRTGNASEGSDHTWTEINSHPASYYDEKGVPRYKVEAILQVGDESGPLEGAFGYDETVPNATVQIRGQSSSRNSQKSYKISIKKNHGSWRGQTTIALNKHPGDLLRYRNKLGFDLLKGIPALPSLRTQFVHLYVKDETEGADAEFVDYGLYTQVEVWNRTALRAHGFDENGQLYKVINCEFYRYEDEIRLSDDPAYDQEAFERRLEIKGSTDHAKLIAMLEDLNNEEIPIEEVLDAHFDLTNLTYWLAFQMLTGNTDSQNGNFYLYSPLSSDTWYILPWDQDGGFGTDDTTAIQRNKADAPWNRGISNYWGNVLFRRCLQSEMFRAALDEAVTDLHAYLSEERLRRMTDVYRGITGRFVFQAPDLEHNALAIRGNDYARIADRLPTLCEVYYDEYTESLVRPQPFFIGTPQIQEGKLTVRWSASYDLQDDALTYVAQIARDPEMKEVVASYEGEERLLETDALRAGQYFVRVWVRDTDGNEQSAFDSYHYEDDEGWHQFYGVRVFYVDDNGAVTTE